MKKSREEMRKEFKENGGCNGCKNYYNLHVDYITGEHNCCAKENCYLCAYNSSYCMDFEKGEVPLGEISGEEDYDRKKRKAKNNYITLFLYCGGADGVGIYVDTKYVSHIEYGYDLTEALPEIFKLLDFEDNKEVKIKSFDIEDVFDTSIELPDEFTEEEIEALYADNITLFTYLLKKRCPSQEEEE